MAGDNLCIELGNACGRIVTGVILGIIRHADFILGVFLVELHNLTFYQIVYAHTRHVKHLTLGIRAVRRSCKVHKLRCVLALVVVRIGNAEKVAVFKGAYGVYQIGVDVGINPVDGFFKCAVRFYAGDACFGAVIHHIFGGAGKNDIGVRRNGNYLAKLAL